ncbi:uncharacterized protein LOC141939968 isoform X1 [Strix uralensis]|uniref:uncharacterized protein LOC141939968 isoform X1 n=1 Tax=Strix uralensis TaxID=36305 RepID=UPI003DA6D0BC
MPRVTVPTRTLFGVAPAAGHCLCADPLRDCTFPAHVRADGHAREVPPPPPPPPCALSAGARGAKRGTAAPVPVYGNNVPSPRLCGTLWAVCTAHAPWALCSAGDAGPSGSPEQILERGLPECTNASEGGAGAGPVAKHLPWLPVRKADTVGACGAATLPRRTIQRDNICTKE